MFKVIALLVFSIALTTCATVQEKAEEKFKLVGGPCEGCEAIFEYQGQALSPVDTLPGFEEAENKLKITGTIYQNDGKTPAEGVILYIYHTDKNGKYAAKGDETNWAKNHGFTRGWIKTRKNGKYTFFTYVPGIYPDRSAPAHIHPTLLEPNGKYYWVESFHFAGDSLLTEKEASPKAPRGGSTGVLHLLKEGELLVGKRDFVLGKNITPYQ